MNNEPVLNKMGVVSNSTSLTDMIAESLAQPEVFEAEGGAFKRGKMHGLEVILAGGGERSPGEMVKAMVELGVEVLVSIGYAPALGAHPRVGEMMVSLAALDLAGGEKGNTNTPKGSPPSYEALPKLVDFSMAAAEDLAEDDGGVLKVLAGKVVSASFSPGVGDGVYCVDKAAVAWAAVCHGCSLPFLIIRVISRQNDQGEIGVDEARHCFWLLKGIVERVKEWKREV